MFKLSTRGMNDVAPEQNLLVFGAEFVAGMSWGVAGKGYDLNSLGDFIRTAERAPLPSFDIRRGDGLGGLEKFLRLLRSLSGDFRRQPEVSLRFGNIQVGIGEQSLAIARAQSSNM